MNIIIINTTDRSSVLLKYTVLLLFILNTFVLMAQDANPDRRLYWSESRRINQNDFGIKSYDNRQGLSSVVFEIEYGVKGFNFLRKNFNKKIVHYMLCPVSQVVVDSNVNQYIRYQQTLFDLQEIYVRLLRKAVTENRKKLLLTTKILDELKEQIIDGDLVKRQVQYNNETNRGTDEEKQKQWEKIIRHELKALDNFAYDN